jgi:hypothetical protein
MPGESEPRIITPDEDARLRLIEDLWKNPKARAHVEEAIHISHPEADNPGRAARVTGQAILAEVEKRVKPAIDEIANFRNERAWEAEERPLRDKGYDDAQIAEMKKLMIDEGIGKLTNAEVIYAKRNQVAAPRTVRSLGGMSPDAYKRGAHAEYFKGIMDGPFSAPGQDWLFSKADMILNDFADGPDTPRARRWNDPNYWPADPNFATAKA